MIKGVNHWFEARSHVGLLLLRLLVGLRLLYGVLDNVFSWERMTEFSGFLQSQGFPFPMVSAVVSVYAQAICGLLILIGYKIRIASAIMIFNFLVAIIMVHRNDTIEGMTPPLAMLFGSLTLLFTGAGKISVGRK